MITTEIVNNPQQDDYAIFREFADKHEGPDENFTPEEVKRYFFTKAKKTGNSLLTIALKTTLCLLNRR